MDNKNDMLAYLGLGIFLFILVSGFTFLIPIAVIGAFLYFVFIKNNKTHIINTHYTDPMKTLHINELVKKIKHTGFTVVLVILGIILLANMIVVIPAGETGVYHLFGKVRDEEVPSGIHLINPLASIVRMSIRTEQYTMSIATTEGQKIGDDSIEALTKEGLKVHLDMTVLYRLIEDEASEVYRTLGVRYDEKILRPEVRTAIRDVIALYEAKDIYSDKREEAVAQIQERLTRSVEPRGIEIESVLLRNVALPAMLTSAIENKLTAEQEAQRYDFVLQREEKEAQRKRIEAEGQRDAQTIINQSLTDRFLQYLYVQNLQEREGTIYVPYDLPLFRNL
jgi:regulator of protease activity HflC (stomatin/prohibitin superfamily)